MVPAASIILTSKDYQNLTANEYGGLFLPMIILAILISGIGGNFARQHGIRSLLLPSILCNAISMSLLATTQGTLDHPLTTYALLLVGMAMLGAGFGGCLTALNAAVVEMFPKKSATALTSLHALLGIGTVLGPMSLSVCHAIEQWWLAPFSVSVILTCLFFLAFLYPTIGVQDTITLHEDSPNNHVPRLLWVFLAITFLYGFCETVVGNWAPLYLSKVIKLPVPYPNYALAAFWGMVTIGRLLISLITNWISFRWFHALLPVFVSITFLTIPIITSPEGSVFIMGLAGLCCSGLLPLNIGFGELAFSNFREIVSGRCICAYMTGYGAAAYGLGSMQSWNILPLNKIFYFATFPAIFLAILSLATYKIFPPSEKF
ncbi:MAG: hypothetical protein Tsb0021_00060 [Chlamydiales bacterium]